MTRILIAVVGDRKANNRCNEDIIVELETADMKKTVAVAIQENGQNIWNEWQKIESHSCCINIQRMERNV